jgi:hypothetical protein
MFMRRFFRLAALAALSGLAACAAAPDADRAPAGADGEAEAGDLSEARGAMADESGVDPLADEGQDGEAVRGQSGESSDFVVDHEVPSLPWQVQVNTCIGGAYCGGNETSVDLSLPSTPFIDRVVIFAHDNIGQSATANLIVYVDGISVGRQDVRKAGSYLSFAVGRAGSLVKIQSVNVSWPTHPGSNESFIGSVQIY